MLPVSHLQCIFSFLVIVRGTLGQDVPHDARYDAFQAMAESADESLADTVLNRAVPNGYVAASWYPTPHGGFTPDWAESYAKAAQLVANMTLAEKTNITTGTG